MSSFANLRTLEAIARLARRTTCPMMVPVTYILTGLDLMLVF